MSIIFIILAVVIAYLIFIAMTYGLIHIFFPKMDIDQNQLENVAGLRNSVRKIKGKLSSSAKGFAVKH